MRSVKSRLLSLLLILAMLPLCVQGGAIPVQAAYENTYVNTGDQRADIIGVALTQVGYREGSGGYTKYGDWYGSDYMAWCGAFVSWCANQAGIPTSVIKKNGFASASNFGLSDRTFTVSDHLPNPGDLFFKNSNSHVGLVYYVEGDYFYTLEGNTYTGNNPDGVYIRQRSLSGSYYFASPAYQGSGSSTSHNYVKGVEEAHPHREYYKCTDCSSMYYTGNYGTVSTCQECIMANCSHKYSNWTKVDDQYHQGVCSLCGKKQSYKHDWGSDKIIKEATCQDSGLKQQTCGTCGATREVVIPKTNAHQYSEWLYVDNETHYRICQTCSHEEIKNHTEHQREFNQFEHWYECPDCGGRAGMEAHKFPDGCGSACEICKYVTPSGHICTSQWAYNEKGHWHTCVNCSEQTDYAEHIYSADCDETCDICGYTRQTIHNYSEDWESSEKGHWHSCSDCGKVQEVLEHTLSRGIHDEQPQTCMVCGFVVTPAASHVHDYDYECDENSHWGSCECGQSMEKQSHIWDWNSGCCKICGAPLPVVEQPQIPWVMILSAVAAVAATGAVTLGIVVLCKKRKTAKEPALVEV